MRSWPITRIVILVIGLATGPVVVAGELTARVQSAYQKTPVLRAEFIQKTHVESLGRDFEEKGMLVIARPNRFVIRYLGPRRREYISDGQSLWVWRPGDEELDSFGDVREVLSHEALAFLGGLGEMEKEFQVTESGSPMAPVLRLVPLRSGSPFKKILLTVDATTSLAKEVELYPRNGNRSHYLFSRLRREEKISDHEFRPPTGKKK